MITSQQPVAGVGIVMPWLPMEIPLQQRDIRSLRSASEQEHAGFNCKESVELHRRLTTNEMLLGELLQATDHWPGAAEPLLISLARSGQWLLMREVLSDVTLCFHAMWDLSCLYKQVLKKHQRDVSPGETRKALEAIHASGIRASLVEELLSLAVCRHSADVVEFIVETLKAKVNSFQTARCFCVTDSSHTATPLFNAVYFLNEPVVNYLLKVGAKVRLAGHQPGTECIHAPLAAAIILRDWFPTAKLEEARFHSWMHVRDRMATVNNLIEVLTAAQLEQDAKLT